MNSHYFLFISFFYLFTSTWAKPKIQSLFNGKDLTGWSMDIPAHDKKSELAKSFIVRDGMLVSLGKPFGHLLTDKEYEKMMRGIKSKQVGFIMDLNLSYQKSFQLFCQ